MAEIGRSLYNYDKSKDEVFLKEAVEGVEALNAIVMEIQYRSKTR